MERERRIPIVRTLLRDGALNARSPGIDLGKFLRLFLLSSLPQGEILLLWANRDGAERMAT